MTQFTYTLKYKPEGVNTDITEWVDRIDAIEVGTGEIRSAKIRLNAMRGRFVTKTFSGTTPLIDQFDKLRLTITDRNLDVYDVIYEVDNLKPIMNSQVGELIEVECLGMEWNLTKTPFSKPFFQESGFTVLRDVIDFYNDPDSKGTDSPSVEEHTAVWPTGFNNFAQFTANVYPYDLREQSVYSGLIATSDKMGGSVGSGGAGDFFEIGFRDDLTDPAFNQLKIRGFISGSPPDQLTVPTILDTEQINPGEEEGGLQATMAFVQGTWLSDGIGSYPFENALFNGALEVWNNFPEHVAVEWPEDSITMIRGTLDTDGDFIHYKANADTTQIPPDTEWDQYFFTTWIKNEAGVPNAETEGYSKLTKGIANAWKSAGARVDGTTQNDPPTVDSIGMWDHNLVIVDGTYERTWVDCKALDPSAVPSQLRFPGFVFYRGFRVLVNGVGTGNYAGFDNQVIQYTSAGVDGTATFRTFRNYADEAMVAVDNERKVYQLQSSVWTDISGTREGNDCYHPVYDVGNDGGVNNHNDGIGGTYGDDSAVTVEHRYEKDDNGAFDAPEFYRQGAWINFRLPFPSNSHNSNTMADKIGKASGDYEPSTLDAGNMHWSSNGKIGYNHDRAMDLGPMDSLIFATKFLWLYEKDASGGTVRAGNFECRCVMYDSSDNVVIQDFVIPFNGDFTQTVNLPLKDFKIYRGRKPWSFINAASNVFLQQLEILNVFEFKNIQKIGFVWLGPYDEVGRYQPWAQIGFLFPSIEDPFLGVVGLIDGYNLKWSIDTFEFSKPGLIVSDPIPSGRATMLPFDDQPQIINTFNGLQHNRQQLEITKFRRVRYDIVTEGTVKELFGDSIFLENELLVREANRNESSPGANDGDPGTIKLVCKRIRYEITKPPNGPGGFLRYIEGVKRFV